MNEPEMLKPIAVHWKAWEDEPTIGGGPTGNFGPGVLTQVANLRKPEGRIHWAGTQLALISTGYMDGAIESGKRVAHEVSNFLHGIEIKGLEEQNQEKRGYWYTKYLRRTRGWFSWF